MKIDYTVYSDKHLGPIAYCLKHFKKQFCANNNGVIVGSIIWDPSTVPNWKRLYSDDYYKWFKK